jgi:hypothetical protein
MEDKKPKGRPRKTMEALVIRGIVPATWKEDILQMGREGKNKIHFANYLGISRDLLYTIMERDRDFSGTIKKAIQYSEDWFVSKAIEAWGKDGAKNINTTFMKYFLQNTYRDSGWVDRTDITTDNQPITPTDNKIVIDIILPKKADEENEDTGN